MSSDEVVFVPSSWTKASQEFTTAGNDILALFRSSCQSTSDLGVLGCNRGAGTMLDMAVGLLIPGYQAVVDMAVQEMVTELGNESEILAMTATSYEQTENDNTEASAVVDQAIAATPE